MTELLQINDFGDNICPLLVDTEILILVKKTQFHFLESMQSLSLYESVEIKEEACTLLKRTKTKHYISLPDTKIIYTTTAIVPTYTHTKKKINISHIATSYKSIINSPRNYKKSN